MKTFRIIEVDEPSHWTPYDDWLMGHDYRQPSWWEGIIDAFIHRELLFLKLPILFLNPRLGRRLTWPDEHDQVPPVLSGGAIAVRT